MATIERTRVIRPSSRQACSSYRVNIENRAATDDLCVTITHESDTSYIRKYYFSAQKLKGRKSIYFDWNGEDVVWRNGITPSKIE